MFSFPSSLIDSLQIITNFFKFSKTNKLCLVYPSKDNVAQWLSFPLTISILESDFKKYSGASTELYKHYKPGDLLVLNNKAIVEWVRYDEKGIYFKTAEEPPNGPAIFRKPFKVVELLQYANQKNCKLSDSSKINKYIKEKNNHPLDNLLNIYTSGNFSFQRNSICLVGKILSYDNSVERINLLNYAIQEYFQEAKLDDEGAENTNSPLIISKNLLNLFLHLVESDNIGTIIIDGFSYIYDRSTDFSGIDVKNIPTILITDLSEINSFENIGNYGFEFFNFTKENLKSVRSVNHSPFYAFEKKLGNYISFNLVKEICQNPELETATQKIYSIEKDESNRDLNSLTISLIQLTNLVSRIAHIPNMDEISRLNMKIDNINALFQRSRRWLGDSHIPIEECISLLKSIIEKFASTPSEKCSKLNKLMIDHRYDYIICPTEDETSALHNFLNSSSYAYKTKVISVADVNDDLFSNSQLKVILTGWAKSSNMNRIFSSFLFSELTCLFYEFENKYYNSLQRRNRKYNNNIKATINYEGIRIETELAKLKGYDDLYLGDEIITPIPDTTFDILDFELKLDNAEYSKYTIKGNLIDSIKAKRIDFENDFFIYSTESHKLLVINELIEKKNEKANLYRRKLDSLKSGDIIALINTEKDMLVELVEKITNSKELSSVKKWTELWKNLLKEYYASSGKNFKKLVDDLRRNDCKKHEATIRAWLQDESRIGPDDDSDLISIALLTNSDLLNDNIPKVRAAIKKMTGWRMKASDFITDKIKSQIHEFANISMVNKKIIIEGLGTVFVLKIIEIKNVWENIDVRFVNRPLQKEIT